MGPHMMTHSISLKTFAIAAGLTKSTTATFVYNVTASTGGGTTVSNVIATPSAGSTAVHTHIALKTETQGAKIYYTLDGIDPGDHSTEYTQPIIITGEVTLKAQARIPGANPGPTFVGKYTIEPCDLGDVCNTKSASPASSIPGGVVLVGTQVSLTSATDGAYIYYTLDGTEPDFTSTIYTTPIIVNENIRLKTFSIAPNRAKSELLDIGFFVPGGGEIVVGTVASSGGSHRPASIPDMSTPYNVSSIEGSDNLLELQQPLSFEGTNGVITRPLSLSHYFHKHEVTFKRDTELRYCESNEPFVGTLNVPTTEAKEDSVVQAPRGYQLLRIVDFSAEDNQDVCFGKDANFNIRFYPNRKLDAKNLFIGWYDPKTQEVKVVADMLTLNDDSTQASINITQTGKYVLLYDGDAIVRTEDGTEVGAYFADIEGHWSQAYVEELASQGVLDLRTEYRPDDSASRAELVKMTLLAFNHRVNPDLRAPYSDLQSDDWYYQYIATSNEVGVINGYADGSFQPERVINRAEALKVILRTAGLAGQRGGARFKDVVPSNWFFPYVSFAADEEIVSGVTSKYFAPAREITRGEVAKIIVNTQKYLSRLPSYRIEILGNTRSMSTSRGESMLLSAELYKENELLDIEKEPVWCQFSEDQGRSWITFGRVALTNQRGLAMCSVKSQKVVSGIYVRMYRNNFIQGDIPFVEMTWK